MTHIYVTGVDSRDPKVRGDILNQLRHFAAVHENTAGYPKLILEQKQALLQKDENTEPQVVGPMPWKAEATLAEGGYLTNLFLPAGHTEDREVKSAGPLRVLPGVLGFSPQTYTPLLNIETGFNAAKYTYLTVPDKDPLTQDQLELCLQTCILRGSIPLLDAELVTPWIRDNCEGLYLTTYSRLSTQDFFELCEAAVKSGLFAVEREQLNRQVENLIRGGLIGRTPQERTVWAARTVKKVKELLGG